MSTTFGVKLPTGEIVPVARRVGGTDGVYVWFTEKSAELLDDNIEVIPIDNSAQGVFTIGDIRHIINDATHFKVGTFVTVLRLPDGKYWMKDTKQRTWEILGNKSNFYGGSVWKTDKGYGLVRDGYMRLATKEEIQNLEPNLPKINNYYGKLVEGNTMIQYGCAYMPVSWFQCSTNRHISSLVLNNDVSINSTEISEILKYLEFHKLLKEPRLIL